MQELRKASELRAETKISMNHAKPNKGFGFGLVSEKKHKTGWAHRNSESIELRPR
jgi:hypothetical protein